MKSLIFISVIIALCSCKSEPTVGQSDSPNISTEKIISDKQNSEISTEQIGNTVETRFRPPIGFQRNPLPINSFGYYLRKFPLQPEGRKVHLFNGELKGNQSIHAAVLDIDVGNRDLQQCADAVMRLRAEYFFDGEQYEDISFNFVNGFKAEYQKWRNGNKISVNGNKVNWVPSGKRQDSRASFRKYLDIVFSYASTLSLEKEMNQRELEDLQIGDVFIKGGSPGHAVIIVDTAINESTGEQVFMIAQSYMPAQEIHILKNFTEKISPWYSVSSIKNEINTPEWTFEKNQLRSFEH